ncbi:MAG: hypothetical protein LKE33_07360 [Acidaminococcus sp.]|jgi:hypothetical protein|nr:hypothetical protein [Acidaminococcus sp.]MCI2099827.1 hypothetical protein [Acidaminococcus sp.]MCI2114055.1 hypothetical protein [Acidaminococcus sp.]MCI2115925.1 hypothetical protein [Acidaminococcus sp.]
MEQLSELKKQKFSNMVNEINQYFYRNEVSGILLQDRPDRLPIAKEKEWEYRKNPLVGIVYSIIYAHNENDNPFMGMFAAPTSLLPGMSLSQGASLFWSLFLCAVSDEFYDNELNLVADQATAFDFTPEDVEDWITAVKYVLDNNKLSENCNLAVKGEKAKKFFGVQGI